MEALQARKHRPGAALSIAVPLPESIPPFPAEIAIKLDKPLSGKPELNGEIRWEATAEAFTENPFLLTMKAEAARIQGLNVAPCSPVRKKQ